MAWRSDRARYASRPEQVSTRLHTCMEAHVAPVLSRYGGITPFPYTIRFPKVFDDLGVPSCARVRSKLKT